MPLPRVSVRKSVRKPIRPRLGPMKSIRTQPAAWFVISSIRPLRAAISWVITPTNPSGQSVVMASNGSCSLPSIVLVTTCGLPTVSSKPSRRICSTRTASASSPRPCTSHASGRPVSTTRVDTLPTSSVSNRLRTMREVSLCPETLPASGEVLVPMVTEMAGSSTVIRGSACACSVSARVSPIMISGSPATATMSPAIASLGGQQLGDLGVGDDGNAFDLTHPCDLLTLTEAAVVDADQREASEERRRIEVGHEGLQRGLEVTAGRRDVLEQHVEQRVQVLAFGILAVGGLDRAGDPRSARGVQRRQPERALGGLGGLVVQIGRDVEQQVVTLLDDLGDPG